MTMLQSIPFCSARPHSLPIPCAVARQDAASPEAGRHLGGAAFSRAPFSKARLKAAPPRAGWKTVFQRLGKKFPIIGKLATGFTWCLVFAAVLCSGVPAWAGVVENLVFGKPSYAAQISTEARLCSAEDIAGFLGKPDTFSFANSSSGFAGTPGTRVFLLLALQNNGNQRAWGICEVHLPFLSRSVRVEVPDLQPNMSHPAFYVTELTGFGVDVVAGDGPSAKWVELLVK